jgi:uncharacterized protein (TIGR03085 family)
MRSDHPSTTHHRWVLGSIPSRPTVSDLGQAITAERAALVETLSAVGPDASTLAGSWTAADLARHVVAADRLGGIPAAVARSVVLLINVRATEPYRRSPRLAALLNGSPRPWDWSLARLQRPVPWALRRTRVAPITLWEHVVHHEDVRRANGLARTVPSTVGAAVPWLLRYQRARLPDRIALIDPDGQRWGPESATVTVSGPVGELVLWLSGRAEVAEVEVDGALASTDLEI